MTKTEAEADESRLYGTKQVAELLGIPEWRVKNFAEGEAYGLAPSQKVGSGRGSRRLYNLADVLRLAVANELVKCGFTAEAVGRAMREIPESMLTAWWESFVPVLVFAKGSWRVKRAKEVEKLLNETLKNLGSGEQGLFILDFSSLLTMVHERRFLMHER
jgi:hypothetical protein